MPKPALCKILPRHHLLAAWRRIHKLNVLPVLCKPTTLRICCICRAIFNTFCYKLIRIPKLCVIIIHNSLNTSLSTWCVRAWSNDFPNTFSESPWFITVLEASRCVIHIHAFKYHDAIVCDMAYSNVALVEPFKRSRAWSWPRRSARCVRARPNDFPNFFSQSPAHIHPGNSGPCWSCIHISCICSDSVSSNIALDVDPFKRTRARCWAWTRRIWVSP
jgi:hypothetical protein